MLVATSFLLQFSHGVGSIRRTYFFTKADIICEREAHYKSVSDVAVTSREELSKDERVPPSASEVSVCMCKGEAMRVGT